MVITCSCNIYTKALGYDLVGWTLMRSGVTLFFLYLKTAFSTANTMEAIRLPSNTISKAPSSAIIGRPVALVWVASCSQRLSENKESSGTSVVTPHVSQLSGLSKFVSCPQLPGRNNIQGCPKAKKSVSPQCGSSKLFWLSL